MLLECLRHTVVLVLLQVLLLEGVANSTGLPGGHLQQVSGWLPDYQEFQAAFGAPMLLPHSS
jgi:hypothetical protein